VAEAQRGMGRGLAAILAVSSAEEASEQLLHLPLGSIAPNPDQPRKRFDEDALTALAGSLSERGVLQPVLVRPKPGGTYELIAGERRWRAAQIAGLESIPAIVCRQDDAAAIELALIENMARADLTPIEEARACAALVEELGLSQGEVGRRVGRGRVAVSNLLRLLDLPDEAVDMIEQGKLSEGHGRALLLASDHTDRRKLAKVAAVMRWSVRRLEAEARKSNETHDLPPKGNGRSGSLSMALHPDQEAACMEIALALEHALGTEVRVRADPKGGYRAELGFSSPQDAHVLAQRLAHSRL
jgi:ParB family transcriptional regulator, chromosome partitioning protein